MFLWGSHMYEIKCFSPINLFYIHLIIRLTKNLGRVEGKLFPLPYTVMSPAPFRSPSENRSNDNETLSDGGSIICRHCISEFPYAGSSPDLHFPVQKKLFSFMFVPLYFSAYFLLTRS